MIFDDLLSGVKPTDLAMVGTGLQLTGNLYTAYEKAQHAEKITQAAQFTAAQLEQNAGQARAAAQMEAAEQDRQGRLMASRALAVAAGSGAGASDPTVLNIISRNAAETAYRRAVALYQGETRATGMERQAEATVMQGDINAGVARSEAAAQSLGASASLMTSMAKNASMYQRFAGGGPRQAATSDAPSSSSVLGWLSE